MPRSPTSRTDRRRRACATSRRRSTVGQHHGCSARPALRTSRKTVVPPRSLRAVLGDLEHGAHRLLRPSPRARRTSSRCVVPGDVDVKARLSRATGRSQLAERERAEVLPGHRPRRRGSRSACGRRPAAPSRRDRRRGCGTHRRLRGNARPRGSRPWRPSSSESPSWERPAPAPSRHLYMGPDAARAAHPCPPETREETREHENEMPEITHESRCDDGGAGGARHVPWFRHVAYRFRAPPNLRRRSRSSLCWPSPRPTARRLKKPPSPSPILSRRSRTHEKGIAELKDENYRERRRSISSSSNRSTRSRSSPSSPSSQSPTRTSSVAVPRTAIGSTYKAFVRLHPTHEKVEDSFTARSASARATSRTCPTTSSSSPPSYGRISRQSATAPSARAGTDFAKDSPTRSTSEVGRAARQVQQRPRRSRGVRRLLLPARGPPSRGPAARDGAAPLPRLGARSRATLRPRRDSCPETWAIRAAQKRTFKRSSTSSRRRPTRAARRYTSSSSRNASASTRRRSRQACHPDGERARTARPMAENG